MIPEETYFDGAYYMEKVDHDNTNDLVELLTNPNESFTVEVAGSSLKGTKVENLNLHNRNWKAIGFSIPRNDQWATTRIQFTSG